MMRFKVILYIGFFFFLGLISSQRAEALKVNTHVWVAQEIIDDLEDDGKLTIYVNGKVVKVTVDNAAAILQFQNEFRAGSVGPDAAPDVLLGQTLIHPGTSPFYANSWGTDGWFSYLDNIAEYANEKAYMKGFLTHMAADVISHTYVNMYSGNAFNIGDDYNDLESERRHFMLESYIGEKTPGLSNSKDPWDTVRLPVGGQRLSFDVPGDEDCIKSPEDPCTITPKTTQYETVHKIDLIQDAFFYDPAKIASLVSIYGYSGPVRYPLSDNYEVYNQYQNNAGAAHIKAIYDLRYRIEQLINSPALHTMDTEITKYVIYYWTDGEYMPSTSEAELFNEWHQEVKSLEYDANEEIHRIKNEIEDFLQNSNLKVNSVTESLAAELDRHNAKIFSITSDILDLKDKIRGWEDDLADDLCPDWDPFCNAVNDLRDKIHDAESDIERKIIEFAENRDLLSDTLKHLHEIMLQVNIVRRSVDDVAYDIASITFLDVNPIRALLKNWRNGLDSAMASYQKVGLDMMKEAMKPDGSVSQPLKDWAITNCNFNKIVGMGDNLSESACRLKNSISALNEELGFISTLVQTGDPILAHIKSEIDEIVDDEVKRVRNNLRDKLIEETLGKIPPELASFLEVLQSKGVTDTQLNDEFKFVDPSLTERYLEIPDIASRVKSEMRLTTHPELCKGKPTCFNKNKYPVIYNATVLAKLALLSKPQLEVIEQELGVPSGTLGRDVQSLLIGSVKNIDGSHHWYGEYRPPYPRSADNYTAYYWHPDEFGSNQNYLLGDNYNRGKVLNQLFIGPLAEGLFTPVSLGNYEPLLTQEYLEQYSSCHSKPFLSYMYDTACANEFEFTKSPFNPALIPVINLLIL